jgi:hypothetical protein
MDLITVEYCNKVLYDNRYAYIVEVLGPEIKSTPAYRSFMVFISNQSDSVSQLARRRLQKYTDGDKYNNIIVIMEDNLVVIKYL